MAGMTFPRAITRLHQIEITSRCNLKCVYCPSRDIVAGKYPARAAVDMTPATFERALLWVRFYVRTAGQAELNLAGIGESTLHPDFVSFVRLAREALPHGRLIFATNGLLCDPAMIEAIAPYKPEVWVSLHRPEKAGIAVKRYREAGLLGGVSADPSINANDWAGQVKWTGRGAPMPCSWLREGKVMVCADGNITTCCLDAAGVGVVGHVSDPIGSCAVQPYSLCASCHHVV